MYGVLFHNGKRYNCVRLYSFGDGVDAAGFARTDTHPDCEDPVDLLVLTDARITIEEGLIEVRGYELSFHDGHAYQDRAADGAHYVFRSVRFVPYTVLAHFREEANFDGRPGLVDAV